MMNADTGALLSELKSGDLVLFAGQGVTSGLLKWLGRSAWTHVALVLRGPGDAEPQLWEAGSDGPRRGTRVVRLAVRMAEFRGRMSARCLNRPLAGAQCHSLDGLQQELAERARAPGLLDLMGAADDGWLGGRRDKLGDPTDAELVAEAYQRLGLLDDATHGGPLPSAYRPRQFGQRHDLALKNGYALGPELLLRDAEPAAGWGRVSRQPAEA
jgi:hypothetical protein